MRVSILLFVDVAPEGIKGEWEVREFNVSILLFVDVAPEAAIETLYYETIESFNPSFRGCGS